MAASSTGSWRTTGGCGPISSSSPLIGIGRRNDGPSQKKLGSAVRGFAGPKAEKSVSLALQGGGAHGAFTWGVLDAILEDGRLAIEAVTGASSGAMNAVVLDGRVDGRRS